MFTPLHGNQRRDKTATIAVRRTYFVPRADGRCTDHHDSAAEWDKAILGCRRSQLLSWPSLSPIVPNSQEWGGRLLSEASRLARELLSMPLAKPEARFNNHGSDIDQHILPRSKEPLDQAVRTRATEIKSWVIGEWLDGITPCGLRHSANIATSPIAATKLQGVTSCENVWLRRSQFGLSAF